MENSRVFIVATIAMSGLGNVVFRYGDEVQESQLNGNADDLVKAGYIKLKEVDEKALPATKLDSKKK